MEALYPKVRENCLSQFLESLAPETVVEMWVKLCQHNKYPDCSGFNWDDFESMVRNCETVLGLTLVPDEWDNFQTTPTTFPLSDSEMDERIEGYLQGE